jgi:type I restriction enzyme R subunit
MVTSEVLMSPPDTSEGDDDVASAERAVEGFWEQMMKRYGNESRYQKDLTSRFKSAADPEIIVVVDKLLTGFDAPRNAVLYLTRSLKDHKLLQAIARVNRVNEGKDVGLIVDYYGILQHLDEALDQYAGAASGDFEAHLQEVLQPLERAVRELPQMHSDLWEVFKTVAPKDDQEAMEQYLAAEDERHRFYERLTAFAKTLRLALASVEFHEKTDTVLIARYRSDLKYFMQLRASVARRYAETVDFKQYQGPIQKLLDTYVGAGEVETLVEPVSILDKDAFAEELAAVENPHAKAEMIANRVRRAIHEHVDEDPVFYKRFSELIDKALADAQAERISQLELLATMQDIRDRVRDRRAYEDVPEILKTRDVARSYYDVIRDQFGATGLSVPEVDAAALAALVDDTIRAKRKVDWADDTDVQNQMKIAIEDELFAFKKAHGLDLDFDTIDRILDRVVDVARRRVA